MSSYTQAIVHEIVVNYHDANLSSDDRMKKFVEQMRSLNTCFEEHIFSTIPLPDPLRRLIRLHLHPRYANMELMNYQFMIEYFHLLTTQQLQLMMERNEYVHISQDEHFITYEVKFNNAFGESSLLFMRNKETREVFPSMIKKCYSSYSVIQSYENGRLKMRRKDFNNGMFEETIFSVYSDTIPWLYKSSLYQDPEDPTGMIFVHEINGGQKTVQKMRNTD